MGFQLIISLLMVTTGVVPAGCCSRVIRMHFSEYSYTTRHSPHSVPLQVIINCASANVDTGMLLGMMRNDSTLIQVCGWVEEDGVVVGSGGAHT